MVRRSEMGKLNEKMARACGTVHGEIAAKLAETRGQGTTEYAILVGVLVVIAILSIVTFRGKVQELWDAIASGMGSL